jgi:hypothetical protein
MLEGNAGSEFAEVNSRATPASRGWWGEGGLFSASLKRSVALRF